MEKFSSIDPIAYSLHPARHNAAFLRLHFHQAAGRLEGNETRREQVTQEEVSPGRVPSRRGALGRVPSRRGTQGMVLQLEHDKENVKSISFYTASRLVLRAAKTF